jgi:hypothetical protein
MVNNGFIICLFGLLAVSDEFVQANKKSENEINIYQIALLASLDEISKLVGDIDDSNYGKRIRTDFNNIIMMKNPEITNDLPEKLGEHHIEYLDSQQLIERFKRTKKKFSILEASPAQAKGSRIVITFSLKWVSYDYKKKKLSLAWSDWSNAYFRFDCDQKIFVLDEVKLGGF